MTADLAGMSQADAIRAALADVGDDVTAAIAWLAERGRPGVKRQRVCDVLARDGRPIGKPRPAPRPGAATRKHAAPRPGAELGRLASAWDAQAPPVRQLADPEGAAEGETCPECGGPMQWASARTMVACPDCRKIWRSSAARTRAAEVAERWAPTRQGNRAPTPAERAQAEADAAEALDRIDGYRAPLAQIPRADKQRPAAVRALHYLDKLAAQYGAAASADDIAAADARESELVDSETGEIDTVLSYAEQLAKQLADDAAKRAEQLAAEAAKRDRREARRAGGGRFLRLGRSPDGTYEYPDDDDQADAPELPGGGLGTWCRQCGAPRDPARPHVCPCGAAEWSTPDVQTSAPRCDFCTRRATLRIDPLGRDGQQGRNVCDGHSRHYPADAQIVADYAEQLASEPPPLAIAAPVPFWDRFDRAAAQLAAAQRTGGRP